MVRDAQGFDPEEDYTVVDNPFWDQTDAAHPAWWRGHDQTTDAIVRQIHSWLDDPLEILEAGMYGHAELQRAKERVIDLRKSLTKD